MIQDIFPSKFDNAYENHQPEENSRVVVFQKEELLVSYDDTSKRVKFPRWNEFSSDISVIYLFSIDDVKYFMMWDKQADIPKGYEFYSMKSIRRLKVESKVEVFAAFCAYHLWKWYATSGFCGACGERTKHDDKERAMVCPACANRIYPRINPAVIVGVTNQDKLLLTKYQRGHAYNALVAGFVEFGETLEETVKREVMEEVGLRVRNIRYYKSQPWGVASDILTGFFCEVEGDDTIHMDETELKYAQWVRREEIELQPFDYSLTNEMMKIFKEAK